MIASPIKKLRYSTGLSLRALGEEMGLPHTTLHRIENGGPKRLYLKTAIKIARYFGKDVFQLMDDYERWRAENIG